MTIAMHRLLPPQSTALERAIVDNAPNWDALTDSLGAVEAVRPDAFKPWLAAEWQVAQFAQYFQSADALLTAALPWLFERGTPAAVRRVLGWLGYDQIGIEEDGAYLHIDLGRVASDAEIAHILHVVTASLPAHVRFYRVVSGYDLRPITLDHGPALDAGLLDDDSGVWIDGTGLKASFGILHLRQLPPLGIDLVQSAHVAVRVSKLSYDDMILLDAWHLDSEIMVDASSGNAALYAVAFPGLGELPQPSSQHAVWDGCIAAWDAPLPLLASIAHHDTSLSSPAPRRGWSGPWLTGTAGRWATVYESSSTQLS